MIEHLADHRHAPGHPLPGTTQFAMVELGHRAFAVQEGLQQRHHGVGTDSITLSEIIYFLQALVC